MFSHDLPHKNASIISTLNPIPSLSSWARFDLVFFLFLSLFHSSLSLSLSSPSLFTLCLHLRGFLLLSSSFSLFLSFFLCRPSLFSSPRHCASSHLPSYQQSSSRSVSLNFSFTKLISKKLLFQSHFLLPSATAYSLCSLRDCPLPPLTLYVLFVIASLRSAQNTGIFEK